MTTAKSRKRTSATATETPATATDPSTEEVLDPEPETPPVEEAEGADTEVKEAGPQPEAVSVVLVYRGNADVFEHGPFRIRPGQPVTVPSDVAEELLTYPREPFERISQE